MKEKILIVEDNHQHMRLIEMTLGTKSYTLLSKPVNTRALSRVVAEMLPQRQKGNA